MTASVQCQKVSYGLVPEVRGSRPGVQLALKGKPQQVPGCLVKFDGYRMLARIESGDVKLITRNGHDWTARMPRLRDALAALPVDSAWIDGEAVVLDASGKHDFNALQNAFDRRSTADIVLYVFDLLWLNGTDIREQPLRSRRPCFTN